MIFRRLLYFYERKILPGYKVGKKDLVIDIGCGDKPFWRANVFFDNLNLADNQRFTRSQTSQALGIFVNGDITKTKFANKFFDFSFCSHVLEHVERPELALKEIMRISKAGYIEVPNGILDYIEPFSTHLWFVYFIQGKLIFYRKSKSFHEILLKDSKHYAYLFPHIKEPFIRLYWKGKIDFEVINECKKSDEFKAPIKEKIHKQSMLTTFANTCYMTFIVFLRNLHGIDKEQIKPLFI